LLQLDSPDTIVDKFKDGSNQTHTSLTLSLIHLNLIVLNMTNYIIYSCGFIYGLFVQATMQWRSQEGGLGLLKKRIFGKITNNKALILEVILENMPNNI